MYVFFSCPFPCICCMHIQLVCQCMCTICMCGGVGCLCRGSVFSVGVDEEAGEGAVFVCVPPVDLPSVQLHAHLIAHVQVQDHAVGGVVVVLISVLSDGAGSYLSPTEDRGTLS